MSPPADWVFLLPALDKFHLSSGGALNTLGLAELLGQHVKTSVVTYRTRCDGYAYLDDVEAELRARKSVFCYTWGPDVTVLAERLRGARQVYRAGSADWGVDLPPEVPIFCNSRFIMLYWMHHAPHNLQFLVPPVLDSSFYAGTGPRDTDVLLIWRKSTHYLRETLTPALTSQCRVHVQRDFIDRQALGDLYRRAKVYLYAFAPQKSELRASGYRSLGHTPSAIVGSWAEGFGTQVLEAMACGCTVFSNLRGGMVDFMDVEVDSFKLEVHSLDYDIQRILKAIRRFPAQPIVPSIVADFYSPAAFHRRMPAILAELENYFQFMEQHGRADLSPMLVPFPLRTPGERAKIVARRLLTSVRNRVRRLLRRECLHE